MSTESDFNFYNRLHKVSSELELSYGNFDVVFIPERLNFFDASQEKLKLPVLYKNIFERGPAMDRRSVADVRECYTKMTPVSNFKSVVAIYAVNCRCHGIGKMLMPLVR